MECIYSAPTITDNTFEDNYTNEYGGGLVADNCQGATISGNTFIGNQADWYGGGLAADNCQGATISGNTVIGNQTQGGGGGFDLYEMDGAILASNVISGNVADRAAGLYLTPHGVVTMTGNLIANNTADTAGGAQIDEGLIIMSGDRFEGNVATWGIGGLLIEAATVRGENLVVADNEAHVYEMGGIVIYEAAVDLLHSTVARNDGTGIYAESSPGVVSTVTLTNSIVTAPSIGLVVDGGNIVTMNGVLWGATTPVTISASTTATVLVQNELVGDPAFDIDGYHLTDSSDAIDHGVDSGVAADIDGDARPYGGGYDLGADEALVDLPIVGLAASNDSPTELGSLTTLTATVTAGWPVTYTWTFGDGDSGEGAVVTHTYLTVGVFTATVSAWNSVNALTTTTSVLIEDVPIAGLTAVNDSPTELGSLTALTASVTAGSNVVYEWDLGDGSNAAGATVDHEYLDVGVYTAVVTASNGVGPVTASTTVTVTDVPIAGLTAVNDSPTELGSLTTLTASVAAGTNVLYEWDLGDGSSAAGATVDHQYLDVGVYTAVVTASNGVSPVECIDHGDHHRRAGRWPDCCQRQPDRTGFDDDDDGVGDGRQLRKL